MSPGSAPHVLGFDLRLQPADLMAGWTDDRRRQFLLRDDIETPLSVDPMVWPSKFWQPHVPPGIGAPRHLGTVIVPAGTEGYTTLGLWTDLDALKHFARSVDVDIRSGPLLAIVAWPGDESDFASYATDADRRTPEVERWDTVGFDVADWSFVSGLNNCGYEQDERAGLASAWASNLNHHGLLVELDAARRFADMTDERVPEHAPFLVFELRTPGPDTPGML
jgi:hypothetical protein